VSEPCDLFLTNVRWNCGQNLEEKGEATRGREAKRERERLSEREGEKGRQGVPKMSSRKKGAGSGKDKEATGKTQAKIGEKQRVAPAGAGGAPKGGSVLVLPKLQNPKDAEGQRLRLPGAFWRNCATEDMHTKYTATILGYAPPPQGQDHAQSTLLSALLYTLTFSRRTES
jgi:hypothetical protein